MKAIILIGGLGTRLRPLTCNIPKPLLPVLNKPFILYQIELLKKHGIKDIVLCMAYLPKAFKQFLGDGSKFGVSISYAIEDVPLGTGGAIKNAEKFVDSPVLIFNGDVMTDVNLTELVRHHREKKSKATITLVRVADPSHYGLVETRHDGRISRFLEKPSLNEITCDTINAGIYIFDPEIFREIPSGTVYSVERGLFPKLLENKTPFYSYIYSGYWIDIGTTEKYFTVHKDLMGLMKKNSVGKMSTVDRSAEITGRLVMGSGSVIGGSSKLSGCVCLGNDVSIGNGCRLSDCIILDGSKIGDCSRIEKSLVGRDCVLEDNVQLNGGCSLGDKTVVRRYSKL